MVQPLALVVFSHKPGSTPPFSVPLTLLHTPDLISLANVLFDLQNPTHKWPPGESPNPQGERQVMVLHASCICALTSIKVLKTFHGCDWYFFFSQPKQNLSLREQGSRTGLGSHGIPRTWNTADQKQKLCSVNRLFGIELAPDPDWGEERCSLTLSLIWCGGTRMGFEISQTCVLSGFHHSVAVWFWSTVLISLNFSCLMHK